VSQLSIVIIGLSITSSWGNGHATTYRGLVRELCRRGHDVLFLERDVPYYAHNRDLPKPPYGRTELYGSLEELAERFAGDVARADAVMVGSYVPDGVAVGDWVLQTARGQRVFYDIDTPITIAALAQGSPTYLEARQVRRYDLYLSFTTGPLMQRIASEFHAPRVRPLCCSADVETYYPEPRAVRWDLGYLGTFSSDRQPALDRLLVEPARAWAAGRFSVAGPQYPALDWPGNIERQDHVPPPEHRAFYNSQRFTLNITRSAMLDAGYSPSIRLFEAGACGTPIISDDWPGLGEFFVAGRELFVATSTTEVLRLLREVGEDERLAVGQRGRERVLAEHTAAHRAEALEGYLRELEAAAARSRRRPTSNILSNLRGQS
jgi:spore maturation protein CgeB